MPLKRIPKEENTRVSREEIRKWVVSKLKLSISSNESNKEEESETSDSSESNEEGEDDHSEDEPTNVSSAPKSHKRTRHISRKDKHSRATKASPSGDKDSEPKRPKRIISPIKFPDKTPTKSEKEMPPLSRLPSRGMTPLPTSDLRQELNLRPPSSKPKIDSGAGPIQNRISCNFPPALGGVPDIPAFIPWLPGQTPINNQWLPATDSHMRWRTPHSSRPFITGNTTSRNDGTMTGQEEDENPEGSENTPREPDENEN